MSATPSLAPTVAETNRAVIGSNPATERATGWSHVVSMPFSPEQIVGNLLHYAPRPNEVWAGAAAGMVIAIAIMVFCTALLAGLVFAPRLQASGDARALVPDRPQAFGYKMAWLAIRTQDTARIADILRLREVASANWSAGLAAVYSEPRAETHIFVTPPVEGWTLVAGLALPHPLGRNFVDKATPLLLEVGGQFKDVQYYFSYPDIDFFAWARVTDGKLVRAFAIGDEGIIWNKGRSTREEQALGLKLFELRGVAQRRGDAGAELLLHPTEEHVVQLARSWSLDPTRLDARRGPARLGYLGRAPVRWRPERTRRAA
jgi:hypothetical protein